METQTQEKTKTSLKIKTPKLYKVLMHNDDVTPMDFVVSVLELIFKHTPESAYDLMMTVHTEGVAVCGVYTKEIAETRCLQAKAICDNHAWPLKLTLEPTDD